MARLLCFCCASLYAIEAEGLMVCVAPASAVAACDSMCMRPLPPLAAAVTTTAATVATCRRRNDDLLLRAAWVGALRQRAREAATGMAATVTTVPPPCESTRRFGWRSGRVRRSTRYAAFAGDRGGVGGNGTAVVRNDAPGRHGGLCSSSGVKSRSCCVHAGDDDGTPGQWGAAAHRAAAASSWYL